MATVEVGPINPVALRELEHSEPIRELMQRWGDDVASDAAAAAPKRTGEMAASIHCEVVDGPSGLEAHVSWSADRWYGIFAELGTSKETARPFLRPAAERQRRL